LKPYVSGTMDVASLPPHTHGLHPKLGHLPRALPPRHCYVWLDVDGLHMLPIPQEFQGLKDWINIPLSCSVVVSACRFCHKWVQVTYHGGQRGKEAAGGRTGRRLRGI
jgi:hypothetical protein